MSSNTETILPTYVDYLLDAADATSQVSEFDLHEDDPKSKEKFAELLGEEADANLQLIEFVVENSEALKVAFQQGSDDDAKDGTG